VGRVLSKWRGILRRIEGGDFLESDMLASDDMLFGRVNWTFRQNNDPKHTAKVTKVWFEENKVPILTWPAQSAGLNPIENLWSILDRVCSNRVVNNEQQLFNCLNEAWKCIPVGLLTKLVDRMPARCQAVIDSKGYPTKY
jgi:hypothetical protein